MDKDVRSEVRFPSYAETLKFAGLSQLAFFRNEVPSITSPVFKDSRASKIKPHYAGRNKYDTDYFIATSDEHKFIVLALGGSESKEDWLTNFIFIFSKFGPEGLGRWKNYPWSSDRGTKVHYGFNRAFFGGDLHTLISLQMNSVVERFPGYRIFICGHSLGASLSMIAGAFIAKQRPRDRITVLAYGPSRVGNDVFCKWVNAINNLTMWKFVYGEDPVPRLPAHVVGYRDAGHLIEMKKEYIPKAYFLHWGDHKLGFRGPSKAAWNVKPLINGVSDNVIEDHYLKNLIEYLELQLKVQVTPSMPLVSDFEKLDLEEPSWLEQLCPGCFGRKRSKESEIIDENIPDEIARQPPPPPEVVEQEE